MQVVADEEDADTLLLQMVNQLGNHGGLLRPERRGRLVHDEDFGVEQDGAGDGDRLALTAREVLHRVLDVLEVRVEAMQHRARLVLHGIGVEQPERRPQLADEKEVGRGVEIFGQGARETGSGNRGASTTYSYDGC